MEFLNVDIEIERGRQRHYPLTVRSPAGGQYGTMQFPLDDAALKTHLQELQAALARPSGLLRRILADKEHALHEVHKRLFEELLPGPLHDAYLASLHQAEREHKGLRLRLLIKASELVGVPWEYLYDPSQKEYLNRSKTTQVVRYTDLPVSINPALVTPPLNILLAAPSPKDRPAIDLAHEKEQMRIALSELEASGLLTTTWLEGETLEDLSRQIGEGRWHVFHFLGHGTFDEEGFLAFNTEQGESHEVSARVLYHLWSTHGALRLMVLQTPKGAPRERLDVFASSAATLASRGIAAVLAMPSEMSDRAASQGLRAFYTALTQGSPVDRAVIEARSAISLATPNSVEWGTPLLHMRRPDGVLFELTRKSMMLGSGLVKTATQPRILAKSLAPSGDRHSGKLIRPPTLRELLEPATQMPEPLEAAPAAEEEAESAAPAEAAAVFFVGAEEAESAPTAAAPVGEPAPAETEEQAPEEAAEPLPTEPPAEAPTAAPVAPPPLASAETGLLAALNPERLRLYQEMMQKGAEALAAQRYEEALAAFDRAAQLASKTERAHLGKGDALLGLHRAEEALLAYERALQLQGTLAPALLGKARAYVAVECYEDALTTLQRFFHQQPEEMLAWCCQANALAWLHREEEALAAYEHAIELGLDTAEVYNGRGVVLWWLKRYQEALLAFERAIERDPASGLAQFNKAEALRALKRLPEAQAALRLARQLGYQEDA